MAKTSSTFSCDINFCSECGSILPLPDAGNMVSCKICGFQRQIAEYAGRTIVTEIYFARRNNKRVDVSEVSDPMVDRICPKCKHEGMTYATVQLRSADEGQTVFYSCPKCKFKENENS